MLKRGIAGQVHGGAPGHDEEDAVTLSAKVILGAEGLAYKNRLSSVLSFSYI